MNAFFQTLAQSAMLSRLFRPFEYFIFIFLVSFFVLMSQEIVYESSMGAIALLSSPPSRIPAFRALTYVLFHETVLGCCAAPTNF